MKPNLNNYGPCTFTTPGGEKYKSLGILINQKHLLIGGSRESGKNTLLNDLIWQLLYNADISLILIDSRRTDLIRYKDLHHTMRYSYKAEDIQYTLEQACSILDKRYDEISSNKLKSSDFNDIYVIIAEYADICIDQKSVDNILRLIKLGSGCKIHVWLATYHPAKDILTETIKTDFECRIALRCNSQEESINIIGIPDAAMLKSIGENGMKEAIVIAPEFNDPIMIDILNITDAQLDERAEFWLNQLPQKLKPKRHLFKRIFNRNH